MIDSFKYLPRSIAHFYKMTISGEPNSDIPWTPLNKPLSECTISLVTTGGLFQKEVDEPFDVEREKNEPTWGDPSFRKIPSDITQEQLGASHLHINTEWVLEDINRLLPIGRLKELESAGEIGRVAPTHYSFMGFQGYPHNTEAWTTTYGPQLIEQLKQEQVDAVLLTPAWPDCAINVPVLARLIEAAGIPTVLVTMMPYFSEIAGTPRTLAVEFPFGQTMGHEAAQQIRVLRQALEVLATAETPNTIVHSEEEWPIPQKEAYKTWQPAEPSPIIGVIATQLREMMRQNRNMEK